MKITQIKPILTDRYLLVRVYTDKDIIGNGEAGYWEHPRTTAEHIRSLSEYFVGKDPRTIEHHHQTVSRNTHFSGVALSAALSAIDIALWDILGKSVGLPVYQLLGGKCRDKIRVFENVGGDTIEARVESAKRSVANGFTSLRTTPFFGDFEKRESTAYITQAIEIVAAIRDAIGFEIDLGVEIHRNLQTDEAITLAKALEPYRLKYYEDPLPPRSVEAHEYIAKHIDIPMALGERCHDIFQFKDLIDRKLAAYVRSDMSIAGGFTQTRKIAGIAEAASVQIFPHLMGSPINHAAFAHFAASIPNYYAMEAGLHTTAQRSLVDRPFEVVNGYREVPDRPGIGIEIDEAAAAEIPAAHRTLTGNFASDGSVAH
jgi:galactonate dehydratase